MGNLAKIIIVLGIVLIVAGILMLGLQKLPFFGKLPGDIVIKKQNYTLYFPLATSIIISIIVSLIFYLIEKFK